MLLYWIDNLATRRRIGLYIAAAALLLSLTFCFVIYPRLPVSLRGQLDPDNHGRLGWGLWRNGSLSYFPDTDPTVERGPIYPAFVAFTLAATNGWYPGCVQAGQCILFALQCLIVFWIGRTLWGNRAAVAASAACACHPFLIWYLSRLRLEIPATFLFTSIAAASLYFSLKPGIGRAVLLGLSLGLGALCKSNMLPFIVLVPLILWRTRSSRISLPMAGLVALTAIMITTPWTVRNWRLTGKFIPVHVLLGVNLHIGDVTSENYLRAPFSFDELWMMGEEDARTFERKYVPDNIPRADREVIKDSLYVRSSLDLYRKHPTFLVRKILLNSVLFWFLGESKAKSILINALNLPLIILYVAGITRNMQHSNIRSIVGGHLMLVALFYISHIPLAACARYAVIVIPTMLIYAAGILSPAPNYDLKLRRRHQTAKHTRR